MNLEQFAEEMDYDFDCINMIIDEYIRCVTEQLVSIRTCINTMDFVTAQREAHSIKGGARNLMAERLAGASSSLEEASRDQNGKYALQCLETVQSEFEIYKRYIDVQLPVFEDNCQGVM